MIYFIAGECDSLEKMAEYFDLHSSEDLEWEPADLKIAKKEGPDENDQMVHVSVKLSKQDLTALRKAAKKAGISQGNYLRLLIRKAVSQ
ncbi:MAG: hypothetical protein AB1523_07515 [Bacillota bacterium]